MAPRPTFVRFRIATWLALVFAASGCVVGGLGPAAEPSDTEPGEIPFRLAGPGELAVVVPVRIDGRGPYDFVVDTGATFTCVDASLADELGLETKSGTVGLGAGVGGAGALRLVDLPSLSVGTAVATRVPAAVVDLGNLRATGLDARGLLGLNVLKSYRVTFDFERRVLSLDAPVAARRE